MTAGATSLSRSPFDNVEFTDKSFTPLWTIQDFGDEEVVKKWLNNAVEACEDYYRSYFQICQDNLLLFRGIQWIQQDRYANRWLDRQGILTRRSPRVVINHLYDFTEQWVSRAVRYRPAVAIRPANVDQQDADDAKIAKYVLDHIWYLNGVDNYLQQWMRHVKIFGEGYMFITWDPRKGDLHPDYVKELKNAQAQGADFPRIPVFDSEGNAVNSGEGKQLTIDTAIFTGDVKYSVIPPWRVMDQPCRDRDKIEWTITWDTEDIEYLKAKYPEQAKKIKHDQGTVIFPNYQLEVAKLKNHAVVYELYHPPCEMMRKGRYIKFVRDCVLENTDYPYSHGQLPYIYMQDISVPDQIRGMSCYQQLFPLQHQINAVASLIYKALVLFSHPKYVMQDGACDINQLLNESTVVSYSGGVAPILMTHPAVSGELFTWLDKLEQTAEKLSGIYTMSRGQAPSGVRAAKALRVLEEQEDKRSFVTMIKYNDLGIVRNAKMTLSVAGDYYDDSDGRMLRIVGRDNEYRVMKFSSANLSKSYDIRIENTTALSQSPSARIDDITELSQLQLSPDSILSKEQIINFLDLTADEQFKDVSTRAYRCAQSENEDMLSGATVADPTPDEDLITHWKTHMQPLQNRDYKEVTSPERKELFRRHIYVTEYLMWKKGFGITDSMGMPITAANPVFQQLLAMHCPNWPVMFEIPVVAPLISGGGAPPTGMAMPPSKQPPPLSLQASPLNEGAANPGIPAPEGPPPVPPSPPVSMG